MKGITPFLWFDTQAEEAANFYVSIFKNSKVLEVTRCGDAGPGPKGSVLVVSFELDGERIIALNGGPQFKLDEAFSFMINCESQDEVDYFWTKLTAGGGQESMCGWLQDKFGLSWQVTPIRLMELIGSKDAATAQRVMQAMMQMRKIDIPALERAAEQK